MTPMTPKPEKPGLQAERTQLSWERSALAFLVAGALPLFGQGPFDVGRTVLPVVGAVLAILAVWLGRRRARNLVMVECRRRGGSAVECRRRGGSVAQPKAEVVLLGWATAGFAVLIVVFSFF